MRIRTLALGAVVLLAGGTLAISGPPVDNEDQLGRKPRIDTRPITLPPVPARPETGPPAVTEPQLVGFTTERHQASAGVLNFTRACQREFPESRICSLEEVLRTVHVPQSSHGSAWVLPSHVTVGVKPPAVTETEQPVVQEVLDCQGWMSTSSQLHGLAFNLECDCFGGFEARSCDAVLAVACCR